MQQNNHHNFRQLILAKHLEVFVPKPKTRELEVNLVDWLDHLLLEAKIPRDEQSEPLLGDWPSGFFEKLDGKKYWENIIYGYSTYETDGHFVGIDSVQQVRSFCNDFREQTLVIKFLLTNYATNIYRDFVAVPTVVHMPGVFKDNVALVPAFAYPSVMQSPPTYHYELYCTHLHYNSLTNHIITGIAETVLWKETEVWSHSWYTVLDRRSMKKGRSVPIVRDDNDKSIRFGARKDEIMCVMDYTQVS